MTNIAKTIGRLQSDQKKEKLRARKLRREQEAVMALERSGQGIDPSTDPSVDPQLIVKNPPSTPMSQDASLQAQEDPRAPAQEFEKGSMSKEELLQHIQDNFQVDESSADASLLDRLRAFQARRVGGSSALNGGTKRFQSKTFEDEDGNIRLGVFDTATGKLTKTSDIAGAIPRVGPDPVTGELGRTTKGKAGQKTTRVFSKGFEDKGPTVSQSKRLTEFRKSFEDDDIVKGARTAVASSNTAFELLRSGNPIADNAVGIIFPRMLGEVGNLTASEQAKFGGSLGIKARVNRTLERWATGKLESNDRELLFLLARSMEKAAQDKIRSLAAVSAAAFNKRNRDIDFNTAIRQLSGFGNSTFDKSNKPNFKKRRDATKSKRKRRRVSRKSKQTRKGKPLVREIDGVIYNLQPDGKYKPKEKGIK